MFLIMSAAYIDVELQSEFGSLPPSLLPLGNRRLFQHQNTVIPAGMKKFISLPESYQLSEMDATWLHQNGFRLLPLPDGLSLGASLVAAITLAEDSFDNPLHILFGDTLITDLPQGDDIVAITEVEDSYKWATVNRASDPQWITTSENSASVNNPIVCGYFRFSQPRQLIRCITQSHWNFLEGLNRYRERVELTTKRTEHWLDFGHVNTYYRSKAKFTTQRAFNQLTITPNWIEKSSRKNMKIRAEANWFTQLPWNIRYFIPQFMGAKEEDGRFKYRLEYLHHTALNELYVFSKIHVVVWKNIFHSCLNFIEQCKEHSAPKDSLVSSLGHLFGEKTQKRLFKFCNQRAITFEEKWVYDGQKISLAEVLDLSSSWLPKKTILPTVMHGDFCFSNILYDFRTNCIKTIDPRGVNHKNEMTIYGDIRYDIAKLSHSVLGMYDWILADYYDVDIRDNAIHLKIAGHASLQEVQKIFIEIIQKKFHLSPMNLYAMQIQLFLSMLPLHDDDKKRQDALFANAFRLHQILQGYTQ